MGNIARNLSGYNRSRKRQFRYMLGTVLFPSKPSTAKFNHFHKTHPKLFQVWTDMVQRCFNSGDKQYSNYGGRGITVCDRWKDFLNFANDMGNPGTDLKGKSLTLERKDNNASYSPDNCIWADYVIQNNNTRARPKNVYP